MLQVHLIYSLLTDLAYQKSVFFMPGERKDSNWGQSQGLISVSYLEMNHLIISNNLTHESSTCMKIYFLKHQVDEKYNTCRGVEMYLTESKCLSKLTDISGKVLSTKQNL